MVSAPSFCRTRRMHTSTTFERVIRSWRSYDPRKAGVRTWVLAIARNALTDHYRRACELFDRMRAQLVEMKGDK